MSKVKHKQKNKSADVAAEQFEAGCEMVRNHKVFSGLYSQAYIRGYDHGDCPKNGLTYTTKCGSIICNSKLRATPQEWARAIAHGLLHLGMGHFDPHEKQIEWNMACDLVAERFLTDLGFGKPWYHGSLPLGTPDEERIYELLCQETIKAEEKAEYAGIGTAGHNVSDMIFKEDNKYRRYGKPPEWRKLLSGGLVWAVTEAVRTASGDDLPEKAGNTRGNRARKWFISRYPLLGAIAANFTLVEDSAICQRMQISVAAVSPALSEIYINPAAGLDDEELRFVMAHEFLHAALRHDIRCEWRDEYLWNVACDFVINGWLTEMGVGERPEGLLFDIQFKGMSAEAVYDIIVTDMRRYRKLATLRGVGLGDVLTKEAVGSTKNSDVDLDLFYRRALSQGLEYHKEQTRGFIPAGLIEDIRALSHPPIPWDVELARWFDEHFMPIEKVRSYSRQNRRQSSTPDIPRPNWIASKDALDGRTFGVVLDTSGSMSRSMLATALGAIASYSHARDVPAARVVFCDACAHDEGYMRPEDIAGTVKVKGRGGTVLQPGVDMLLKAEDFPKEAPILVITDAQCDKVILYGREHAFLIPKGARLPFSPKGKVFGIEN